MSFCDTHLHLLECPWGQTLAGRVRPLAELGVERLVIPGVAAEGWEELIAAAAAQPAVSAAPGLHPQHAASWNRALAEQLRRHAHHPQVVAIGEIGLDSEVEVAAELQQRAFREQLELAVAAGLPVLIHCRRQTEAVLRELEQVGIDRVGGIWHGFSGSVETAQRILGLGLRLGVGPVLLRDKARKLPEVVRQVSAEALVLETDAPDMIDEPRGLLRVAERLAELRGWSLAETAQRTGRNAAGVFRRWEDQDG